MSLPPLIAGLLRPHAYPHAAPAPRLIETHISWVIVAGDYAYKLKKPVDFGFLDFSTLARRRACCDEEIRVNRRLAPDIYLDVVAVTGTVEAPHMGGDGPPLEWAVRMRAFPAEATLDRASDLDAAQIDAIAARIAAFHGQADTAPADSDYGRPEQVSAPVAANFTQLRALLPDFGPRRAHATALLDALHAWTQAEQARLLQHFAARRAGGYIRECHGDLHLGNIAWVQDAPLIFDAIEFSAPLRFIDVINEIAFLAMDLTHRGHEDLAWRFVNAYLEHTGDYAGVAALPYYHVYRAMVRAKVAALRAAQAGGDYDECLTYLQLAQHLARPRHAFLLLMHGVSGSGKTWLSQHLLQALGAIRLRSDVERKRLFGLTPLDASTTVPGGIYTAAAGEATRVRLVSLTRALVAHGLPVIVDATFIRADWRQPFAELAAALALPWRIVAVEAPPQVLRERIARRQASGHDASEADDTVLDAQLAAAEPFTAEERRHAIVLRGDWHMHDALDALRDLTA